MEITTSPFRHRDKFDAQQLIDCSVGDCIRVEAAVDKSLDNFER